MQTLRRIRRSIAAILLILYLPACYHWVSPKGMTPQEYIAAKQPKQVRVTLADSTRLVLRKPWVSGDSLGGYVKFQERGADTVPDLMFDDVIPEKKVVPSVVPWAVPLSRVGRFEVYGVDAATTVVSSVLVLAVLAGATYLVYVTVFLTTAEWS